MSVVLEPEYHVWLAFGANANTLSPSWTDVSDYLQYVTTSRGSPAELDRNNPGTGTVVLDNYAGRFDSANAGGPYYGNLVPNVRIKILAAFDGNLYPELDGLVDAYVLDYPDMGEATCTITCTDGFKAWARTDLPSSAYAVEVAADAPTLWWRLNDPAGTTRVINAGVSVGVNNDGTVVGTPTFGEDGLIDRDDGTAMLTAASDTPIFHGAYLDLAVASIAITGASAFAVEFWVQPGSAVDVGEYFELTGSPDFFNILRNYSVDEKLYWYGRNTAGTRYGVRSNIALTAGTRYHVVCIHDVARVMKIYINGVDVTEADPGSTSDTTTGTFAPYLLTFGYNHSGSGDAVLDEFALYLALPANTRWATHNTAGRTPWTGDLPGARLNRIADVIGWPAGLRNFATGTSTLQGADLAESALEHAQKVAESDMGELFVSRDGTMTFEGRNSRLNRPSLATYGDAVGEIGYAAVRFDDGELVMRNPVTVSRTDGAAQTATDAALVAKYYPNQYTLDGLYHDSDQTSRYAAQEILALYKTPQRRITGLTLGPATLPHPGTQKVTTIYELYPLVLTLELGHVITVKFRPPNVVAPFTQVSSIEGIRNYWSPTDGHRVELDLSPVGGTGTSAYVWLQLDNANVTIEGSNPGRIHF